MGSLGQRHPNIYKHICEKTIEIVQRHKVPLLPIRPIALNREPTQSDVTFTVQIPAKFLLGALENEFEYRKPQVSHIGNFGLKISITSILDFFQFLTYISL